MTIRDEIKKLAEPGRMPDKIVFLVLLLVSNCTFPQSSREKVTGWTAPGTHSWSLVDADDCVSWMLNCIK